jgi:hypothetical protein
LQKRLKFVVEIFQTLTQLVINLGTLIVEIGALALRHALLIAWVAWWLCAVNWTKGWATLARGGWIGVVLLTIAGAMVWSAIAPSSYDVGGLFQVPNFWWQLMGATLITLLTLFCGWLQGVFGWAPAEIDLEPPAPVHADHGHAHH